ISMMELSRGYIYRDRWGTETGLLPAAQLLAYRADHPCPDLNNKTAIFEYMNKVSGMNQTFVGMFPPQQCLQAADGATLQVSLWLKLHTKLTSIQCTSQFAFTLHALNGLLVHFGKIVSVTISPLLFRPIHCFVRVIKQRIHVRAVFREKRDPNTGCGKTFYAFNEKGWGAD